MVTPDVLHQVGDFLNQHGIGKKSSPSLSSSSSSGSLPKAMDEQPTDGFKADNVVGKQGSASLVKPADEKSNDRLTADIVADDVTDVDDVEVEDSDGEKLDMLIIEAMTQQQVNEDEKEVEMNVVAVAVPEEERESPAVMEARNRTRQRIFQLLVEDFRKNNRQPNESNIALLRVWSERIE